MRPTIATMARLASAKPASSRSTRAAAEPLEALALRSDILTAAHIPHGFSMRRGGVTRAYLGSGKGSGGELNLGFTASDTPENVVENRQRLLIEVFGQERPLVTLRQVHAASSRRVCSTDAGEQAVLDGDGLMTACPGLALGILTADCVPVLVADPVRQVVAAFHAGWRGTIAHIVEDGVRQLQEHWGSRPEEMVAAIGPSIGACCYTVGKEVEEAVRKGFPYADQLFSQAEDTGDISGLKFDLQEANRQQLLASGLRPEAVEVLRWCTRCRNDLFFSYRGEKAFTGRLMSVIALGVDRQGVGPRCAPDP